MPESNEYNKINEICIRVNLIRGFHTGFSGRVLTRPIFNDEWTTETLLAIEDKQNIVTLFSADIDKQYEADDKKAVSKFQNL